MSEVFPTKEELLVLAPQIVNVISSAENRLIKLNLDGDFDTDYIIPYDYLNDEKILFAIAREDCRILSAMPKEYLRDFNNVEKLFKVNKSTFAYFDFDHMGLDKIPGADAKIKDMIDRNPSIVLDLVSYYDTYCKNTTSNVILNNKEYMKLAVRTFVCEGVFVPFMRSLDDNDAPTTYFEKAFGEVLSDREFEDEIMDYVINKNEDLDFDKDKTKHIIEFKEMVNRSKVRYIRDSILSDQIGRPVEYEDFKPGQALNIDSINSNDQKHFKGKIH